MSGVEVMVSPAAGSGGAELERHELAELAVTGARHLVEAHALQRLHHDAVELPPVVVDAAARFETAFDGAVCAVAARGHRDGPLEGGHDVGQADAVGAASEAVAAMRAAMRNHE